MITTWFRCYNTIVELVGYDPSFYRYPDGICICTFLCLVLLTYVHDEQKTSNSLYYSNYLFSIFNHPIYMDHIQLYI